MATLRALLRVLLVLLLSVGAWALWMALRPVTWIMPSLDAACQVLPVRMWARGSLRALGVRLRVVGTPPTPPFVLVCNHLSYVDILVLLAHIDGLMLSKAEVGSWPLIGYLARSTGTLFVDRRRAADIPRVLRTFEATWERGLGVAFFPEGTSTNGEEVLPFKSSLFAAPARAAMPVSVAAITYAALPGAPAAADSVCWWGDDEFAGHAWRLAGLRGIDATLTFGSETFVDDDRKRLAAATQPAVRSLFVPCR